jgi:cytochrome b561
MTRLRYDRVAIALHWLIGIALLAQIGFGFMLDDIAPRGTPARAATINLHKSCGIVLGVLIVLRLAWRLRHAAPAWPAVMSVNQQRAATLGHRTLYACMLLMPLSGYVASNFSKHGVKFFGTALKPWGPDVPQVYNFFNAMHVATAFVFAALIVGHVAISLKHAFVDRDGVFSRILP